MKEQLIIKFPFPQFEEVKESAWYKSKNELVQKIIEICPPTQYYRIKATGRRAVILGYGEPVSQKVEDAKFNLKTIDGFLGLNNIVHGLKFHEDFEVWQEGDEKRKPEPKPFPCGDCGIDTHALVNGEVKNDYMVTKELWAKHGNGDGVICWDCMEKRMGRSITAHDLTDCPLNVIINRHTAEMIEDVGFVNLFTRRTPKFKA